MRESCAVGTANHAVDYSQPCECKDYQANLKVTNKYAERFGLNDRSLSNSFLPDAGRHQASFGHDMPQVRHEAPKREEKASHSSINRSIHEKKSAILHEEPISQHENSSRYSDHRL